MSNTDFINPPEGFEPIDIIQPPEGFEPTGVEPPGLLTRMGRRVMGTDVDDPLPWTRLGTAIAGAIGGGIAGGKMGAMAGGAAGSVVAPGVGTAVGAAGGGLAGVAAGATAPELVMELGEFLGLVEPGTRERVGLDNEDLKTVLEGELLLELATGGGVAAVRLAGRGLIGVFTGTGRAGRQLSEEAATRYRINMMPVQVGNRTLPRSFVSVMGRFPFVGGPLKRQARLQDEALTKAFTNLPARIAVPASMSDVSAEILSGMETLATTVNQQFRDEYAALFAKADLMGVRVTPSNTITKADEILAKIIRETPRPGRGRRAPQAPGSLTELQKYINRAIIPMRGDDGKLAGQSLQQMDQIMEGLDERIGKVIREGTSLPLKFLEEIRNAVHLDMMNMGRGRIGPGGAAPRQIGRELRALDTRFSHTMQELFETATAKRFGSVRRHGIGGISFRESTRIPVDNLARILMQGESVSIVNDLHRMLEPDTFRRLARSVLDNKLETAFRETAEGRQLDLDKFATSIGLNNKKGPRFEQMSRMLELSGGLTMQETEKLLEIGKAIRSVEIPDVSTFVARRGVLGGARSVISAIVPGMVLAGAAGGGAAAGFGVQSVMGAFAFIGGARLTSAAIANPESARALRMVMAPETRRFVRRAAGVRAVRVAIWALADAGQITPEQAAQMQENAEIYWSEVDRQEKASTFERLRSIPLNRNAE